MKEGSICNKCNHRAYCAMSDEANNDNATIKGCYLYSERTAKTNADRIRSMTDEELATFLYNFGDCPCFGVKFCERGTRCEDAVLMKLKEPVDNGACSANETSEKVQSE